MEDKRTELAEEFMRKLAAAIRAAQLYSARHPIIGRNAAALSSAIEALHASQPAITLGIVDTEVVVGDVPIGKADSLGDIMRKLQGAGIERITIERGVEADEIAGLVQALGSGDLKKSESGTVEFPSFPHIRVGRIQVEQR